MFTRLALSLMECDGVCSVCRRFTPPQRPAAPQPVSSNSFAYARSQPTQRTNPLISRAKINTVKQTVLVIAIYIICSAPFICVQLWAAWGNTDNPFFREYRPAPAPGHVPPPRPLAWQAPRPDSGWLNARLRSERPSSATPVALNSRWDILFLAGIESFRSIGRTRAKHGLGAPSHTEPYPGE